MRRRDFNKFVGGKNHMKRREYYFNFIGVFLPILSVCFVACSQAANYPDKPVMIISDAAAGTAPDVTARFVAKGLAEIWGQQVLVTNRPGANGSIAARASSDSAADGYTLFMPSLSTFTALPSVAPNLPVKLPRDFLPIGFTAEQPMFITVDPGLNITTLPQLIERAKKEPDKLSIAVSGVGRLTHLTSELLQARADIKLLSVPYTHGMSSALSDVASSRISVIIENYSAIVGAIKAGQVKPVAVASPKRLPEFPDLPTVAETIPGFSATGWQVLLAPIGTPTQIINKVSADLAKVVSDADLKKRLAAIGSYSHAMTPEEVLTFVAKEQQTWLPVVQKILTK